MNERLVPAAPLSGGVANKEPSVFDGMTWVTAYMEGCAAACVFAAVLRLGILKQKQRHHQQLHPDWTCIVGRSPKNDAECFVFFFLSTNVCNQWVNIKKKKKNSS